MTASSAAEAESIASALLEKKLIACANIFPAVTSVYHWQDKIQKDQELVMIAKSSSEKEDEIIKLIKANHSYDCPAILFLDAKPENDFGQWLTKELQNSDL